MLPLDKPPAPHQVYNFLGYIPIVFVIASSKRGLKCIKDKQCSVTSILTIEREQDFLSTKQSNYSNIIRFLHLLTVSSYPSCPALLPLFTIYLPPLRYAFYPALLCVLPRFAHPSPGSIPTGESTVILLTSLSFWRGGRVRWEIQSERGWFTIKWRKFWTPRVSENFPQIVRLPLPAACN